MNLACECSCLPDCVPARHRIAVLALIAGTNFSRIEREEIVAKGSVSAAAARRIYAYPRLRAAIVRHLAERLGIDDLLVDEYLFGDEAGLPPPDSKTAPPRRRLTEP